MSPKKIRQQNKTVTIYNSKSGSGGKKDKKNNLYEQSRNNIDNWEFHFKTIELEDVKCILKCKDLAGIPLLIGAAVIGKKDVAINLLKHGYNINEADKNNMSPLYWAVKFKLLEMIRFLLSNKADPFIKPNQGDDLLFLALGSNIWDEESFIILLSLVKSYTNFDINNTNRNGVSMIHLAIRREWIDLLDILILNEANINAVNPNGVTPLMLACYRNDYTILDRLLKKNASLKRRNSEGFTALCYALSSAIIKQLEPPFKVVDRVRFELSRSNYMLSDYLKDRFKILLNPLKKFNNQPNAEQMVKNIIIFFGSHIDNGFNMLWKEIAESKLIKESIGKYIDQKEYVKMVLLILNTIISQKPSDILISDDLINSGCLNECIKVILRYRVDNVMTFNSFKPILFAHVNQEKWLEFNKPELSEYSNHFLDILPLMKLSREDILKLQELVEDLKLKLNLTPENWESLSTSVEVSSNIDVRSNSKKKKRRSKALKAKMVKSKNAELTERFNLYGKKAFGIHQESVEDLELKKEEFTHLCDGFDFEEAVRGTLSILKDDDVGVVKKGVNWKDLIRESHLKKDNDKPNFGKACQEDINLTLQYLEGILTVIVNKYKIFWEIDKNVHPSFLDNMVLGRRIQLQQCIEKGHLRSIHKEFYTFTRNVRQLFDRHPQLGRKILKELENLFLTHSIRGETILNQITSVDIIRVNVTMANDLDLNFAKYIQDVVNEESKEIPDIHVNWVKKIGQKCSEINAMGDFINTTEAYGKSGVFSSSLFNSVEGISNEFRACCNKSCKQVSTLALEEFKDSRWCSLVKSLELMDDCQEFVDGRIKISNSQKRSNHLVSINGNFAPLEIGLGLLKDPLAVRFVFKHDKNAKLLKEQIDPILHLRHNNILHYHLCEFDLQYLVIATPLCEYNLGQFVLKMKQSDMKICKIKMIKQLLNGILFLHNQDVAIVHGNLKPSNVLIDAHGNIRIAEFGIHKALLRLRTLPHSTVIWFSTETYKLYKENLPIKCSCSSDIQVAGMLMHFALNDGTHPFGKEVDDILNNLEKAAPTILSTDLELCDLLAWMLLGDPSERPSIHQVLSHIYFWSNSKKWRYIMTCAGVNLCGVELNINRLHSSLDKIAYKENIMSNCWVMTAKKKYPQAIFIDNNNDTASGLLKFIKFVVENNVFLEEDAAKSLSCFILNAFPHFALTLYRMIENTEWTDHVAFMEFHNDLNS